MRRQRVDELPGPGGGQVLSNLDTLHEIEAPAEVDRLGEVGGMKIPGVDQEAAAIDIGSVHPGYRDAGVLPHAEPSPLAAAEIHDAADRKHVSQPRDDPPGGPNRERGEVAIKIGWVFVHVTLRLNAPAICNTPPEHV